MLILALTSSFKDSYKFYENIGFYIQKQSNKIVNSYFFSSFLEIGLQAPKQLLLSSAIVSQMAKSCNKPTIGALYLEQVLLHADFAAFSNKTTTTRITEEDKYWVHLSDIYQYLKEHDVVSVIFSEKVKVDHRLTEAIELKSQGFYEKAEYNLNKVVSRNIATEQYYAFNALFDIYLELGNWNELWKQITGQIDNNLDNVWEDEYHLNFYLPKLIQAELLKTLADKQIHCSIFPKIESWMSDQDKNEYLTRNFSEEIMIFNIIEKKYPKAKKCYEEYLKTFLIDWNSISFLCQKMKLDKLLQVQKSSEIDYLVTILQLGEPNSNTVQLLDNHFGKLKINQSKSMIHWHSVVSFRCFCIDMIITNYKDKCEGKLFLKKNNFKYMHKLNIFCMVIRSYNGGIKTYRPSLHLPLGSVQQSSSC